MTATTNFEKLLATYLVHIQELEQVFFELVNERGLTTSVGAQLDGIGQIVGEERNGRNDADYLQGIQGKILINLSNGTLEEILAIILKVINAPFNLTVREDSFPAHFEIDVTPNVDILGASIVTGASSPYTLANGQTLDVEVDGGAPQTVTFDAADFVDISQATADEVAAELSLQLTGATATKLLTRVVLASDTTGDLSSIEVTGGTAAGAFAFPAGLQTGPEANQRLMIQAARAMKSARGNSIRGILLWSTHAQSFGFSGTTGALGFTQGAFASASDGA